LYLIILHPDNKNYRRLRLNILDQEVHDMLDCRLRAVQENSRQLVILPLPPSRVTHDSHDAVKSSDYAFVDD
jgi:hypothetical protein